MRIALAGIIAAAACLIPWKSEAAGCTFTYTGTLAANSTTTVPVDIVCTGQNYVRVTTYKPRQRTLIVGFNRGTTSLFSTTYGESDTRLAGYGDYPTSDYSNLNVVLTNNGAKMKNVKIVVEAYTQP